MDRRTADHLADCLARLIPLARARDRSTEREPRTITITDDDALALVEWWELSAHELKRR